MIINYVNKHVIKYLKKKYIINFVVNKYVVKSFIRS
jgi:hypothetical protein